MTQHWHARLFLHYESLQLSWGTDIKQMHKLICNKNCKSHVGEVLSARSTWIQKYHSVSETPEKTYLMK